MAWLEITIINLNTMSKILQMSKESNRGEMKIEPQSVILVNPLTRSQILDIDQKVGDFHQKNSNLTKDLEEQWRKVKELENTLNTIAKEATIEQNNLLKENEKLQGFLRNEKLGIIEKMSEGLERDLKEYEKKIKQLELEKNNLKNDSKASEYLRFLEECTFNT